MSDSTFMNEIVIKNDFWKHSGSFPIFFLLNPLPTPPNSFKPLPFLPPLPRDHPLAVTSTHPRNWLYKLFHNKELALSALLQEKHS